MPTKTLLTFTKMHALGNDFVIIHDPSSMLLTQTLPISAWANRHTGIGFDQLLLVTNSQSADFACRIFNSDGSEAEQCGNGLRCVARFIGDENLSDKKYISVELKTRTITLHLLDDKNIQLDMGNPQWEADFSIVIEGQPLNFSVLSLGNPHAIAFVASLSQIPISQWGSIISTHSHFSNGANVGFAEKISGHHILLRTYERGAGETWACGSNACAAAIAGIRHRTLGSEVKVELPLGSLSVKWEGEDHPVFLTGPAEKIFTGTIPLIDEF